MVRFDSLYLVFERFMQEGQNYSENSHSNRFGIFMNLFIIIYSLFADGVICLVVTGAYIVGELLMYETFPTVIRLQGIAFVESIAYAVSSIGPAISRIPFGNLVVPLIIFGCLGLVAMLCVFLIPETVSYALPETVEEADMRGSFYRTAVNLRVPEIKKFDFSVKSMRKKKAARNGEPELVR